VLLAAPALLMLTFAGQTPRASARLEYVRDVPGDVCPSEQTVRDSVAARLGSNPFTPEALRLMAVRIGETAGGLKATLQVVDAQSSKGERALTAGRLECAELIESLVLALSIAIDPQTVAAAPSVSLAPAPPPARVEPRTAPMQFDVSLGATGSYGVLPAVSFGVTAGGRLTFGRVSVLLEARVDPKASVALRGGEIETALTAATAGGCLHAGWFSGCALGSAGAAWVEGRRYDEATRQTVPYAALGIRGRLSCRKGDFALGCMSM
jgi:hypothetical protein